MAKKRVTDLDENSRVVLPKPASDKLESEMEIVRETIMREFKRYKKEIEEKLVKMDENKLKNRERMRIRSNGVKRKRENETDREMERKNRVDTSRNQEWSNLDSSEKKGLKKLRNRIKKGELVIVKTDKSGKLMAMRKEDYLQFGIKGVGNDRKVDREEARKIERQINNHTRFWIKMVNMGENHGHFSRINESKINNSESLAPRYYMF